MSRGPIVHLTSRASLCGLNVFARNSTKPVKAFLGIPYAVKPDRFAPPKSFSLCWSGVRQATEFGPICPQDIKRLRAMYFPFQIPDHTSEDCLNLNVWTPSFDNLSRLPVMVWIHGGGYVSGCSNYYDGTAYAALHNVVFVSINYRVGLLGFISTGDDEIPGNMGLLDQREAFRWIHAYIHCFGGDPDNITLFGQSAGALSISWHLLTPNSHGLFRRVILQSGSLCYNTDVLTKDRARRHFDRAVKAIGVENFSSVKDTVQALRQLPISQIVSKGPHHMFIPTIDGTDLTDHPINLFRSGKYLKVNIMLGFNSDEGLMFVDEFLRMNREPITTDLAKHFLKDLVRRCFPSMPSGKLIFDILWKEYFYSITDKDVLHKCMVQCYGDTLFVSATNLLADLHSASEDSKTFLYQFDHRPSFANSPPWIRADHASETPFVIGEPMLDRLPDIWSEEEKRLSELMVTLWSNFARSGDPNIVGEDIDFCWPQYTAADRRLAVLRPQPTTAVNYRRREMDLWNNVIAKVVENDRRTNNKL